MDDQELAAIEARAAAATPGPWTIAHDYMGTGTVLDDTGMPVFEETEAGGFFIADEDAAFIAHAREDIPRLIAALRAERERADQAEATMAEQIEIAQDAVRGYMQREAEHNQARRAAEAEIARLRAALQEVGLYVLQLPLNDVTEHIMTAMDAALAAAPEDR